MSDKRCPSEVELLSFADADLPPEQLKRVEQHLELCSSCARRVIALHELVSDIAAPMPQPRLDVGAHVAGVMQRLDTPVPRAKRPRWAFWGAGLAAAAALIPWLVSRPEAPVATELAARGGPSLPSLSRDIGLQLYARGQTVRALEPGSRIRPDVALTAGLRTLAAQPAYLLLFAVDARAQVHWIAPEYTQPGSDPQALRIGAGRIEQLLPSAAVFDDLAPGQLRVVAIITREPTLVSAIEALSAEELGGERLMARFPRAEIRQFQFDVSPSAEP